MKLFLSTLAFFLLSPALPIMAASDRREEWEKSLAQANKKGDSSFTPFRDRSSCSRSSSK